jgi:hypothetical protein
VLQLADRAPDLDRRNPTLDRHAAKRLPDARRPKETLRLLNFACSEKG